DLAGVENGADAHRDGLLGYVLLAEEAAGRVLARHRIERDQARAAMARRAGFVEADVPGAANAEDLQVDAAGPANALFVAGAIILDLLGPQGAVGHMNVLRRNVDVIEERFLHPAPVALRIVRRHGVIFVEIEGNDAREVEARFL